LNKFLKIKANMKFSFAFLATSLALVVGCSSMTTHSQSLQLQLSGDKGVSAHVVVNRDGNKLSETDISVPSVLEFSGESFDIVCTQQGRPGTLNAKAIRGHNVSNASASGLGSAVQFKIQGSEISSISKSPGAAESMKGNP
jgi:hypothetical protein